ncbi:MAG: glycosyltransferase, partial [Culicoidibacterales bacterium]
MMKQKLFIFSHALEIGGAERSLIGLLSSLDYTRYDVDLFLLKHDGPFMTMIPKEVTLLQEMPAYRMLLESLA